MTKAQYRKSFLEQRERLETEFMNMAAERFCRSFFASEYGENVQKMTIMLYSSFSNEAGTRPLINRLVASGADVVLPRVDGIEVIPYYVSNLSAMKSGPFGIMEPDPENSTTCDPSAIDMVIVPGLAFDKNGGRLGFGKGYYDRFLPEIRKAAVIIGLCYDFQLLTDDLLPTEDHDIPMDFLLTEKGFFNCKTHNYTGR